MLSARATCRLFLLAICATYLISPVAQADRIHVKNGSLIRGKAIIDEAHPDQYLVIGEKGKTPLVLKKDRVQLIEPEKSVLDEYVVKRKAVSKSPTIGAEDDYEVGLWCQAHKLADLATVHFEGAIKKNANHAGAHSKLGHTNLDGHWLTQAELKIAQGYVLFKGKWITPEEKEQRDAEASANAEQQSWVRRLNQLKTAMINGPEQKSQLAEAQVYDVHEAIAVNAIVRVFGLDEDPGFRKLASKVLGSIPGPEASSALVTRLLNEPNPEVRETTMAELARSKQPNVVPKLTLGLKSESLAVINRAAWALGNLNAVATVPKLVPALISTEVTTVWVQQNGGGGNMTAGFGNVTPGTGYPAYGAVGGQSIPILTGPAVGPGVVAYGATSVPAASLGGGVGLNLNGPNRGPVQRMVVLNHENPEVLAALVKMTGRDFGYDIASWQSWLQVAFKSDPIPAKRVPQP